MKRIIVLAVVLSAALFCQAQTEPKDTVKSTPVQKEVVLTPENLSKSLVDAYKKFGEETGKYLTKQQWDMTMQVLSAYLKEVLDAYPVKQKPVPKN